jgi:hypothetical protein
MDNRCRLKRKASNCEHHPIRFSRISLSSCQIYRRGDPTAKNGVVEPLNSMRGSIGNANTLRFSNSARNSAPNWCAKPPNAKAQTAPPNGDARRSRPALIEPARVFGEPGQRS